MFFLPFQILGAWLRPLLSLALLAGGIWLLVEWYHHLPVVAVENRPIALPQGEPGDDSRQATEEATQGSSSQVIVRPGPWRPGWDRETALLAGGLALVAWSLGGRLIGTGLPRRRKIDPPPPLAPLATRSARGPGDTELHVEVFGPADGTPVVLTHGWGLDCGEWCYAVSRLSRRHRVFVWDLPGLGHSSCPAHKDWSLEKLAGDLGAVLALAGDRPAVLVGHSIGGMIALTYCKLYPDALGTRVAGLVLAQTTYTNPVRTARRAWLYTPLQKPLLEPLCHLMVWLAPLLWLLNWLSYLNGSAQRSTERSTFSGRESRPQLNALTWKFVRAWPAVIARGMLAMFRYDATAVLPHIGVPTLVAVGDRDASCTPEAGEFMARSIPGARLLRLSDARHGGLYEHHDEFDSALEEFVHLCEARSAGREASVRLAPVVRPEQNSPA